MCRTTLLLGFLLSGTVSRAVTADGSPDLVTYNFVLGTQTFAPRYHFTTKTRLVETAAAINQMGSNILKFDLGPRAFAGYGLPACPEVHSLRTMAQREPSCRMVLQMPFAYYLVWAYPHSVPGAAYHNWRDGFSAAERAKEYRELYDLTRYLLTTFNGTRKTFLLGHWEGDWALLGSFDPRQDPSPTAIQAMIDWLNTRQDAIDDATRQTAHRLVHVYQYTEVNLVWKAIRGGATVTNRVLPRTRVDYVSYSSYDSLAGSPSQLRGTLRAALDFIQSQLPPKPDLAEKRVFIGEYGFPLTRVKTPEKQAQYARETARAAVAWGCPFALYWQMYGNESDHGKPRGFWLIDDRGHRQPVYRMHQRFLAAARRFVAEFRGQHGRAPTAAEYRARALTWLDAAVTVPRPVTHGG